jgi:hypothetical protein
VAAVDWGKEHRRHEWHWWHERTMNLHRQCHKKLVRPVPPPPPPPPPPLPPPTWKQAQLLEKGEEPAKPRGGRQKPSRAVPSPIAPKREQAQLF